MTKIANTFPWLKLSESEKKKKKKVIIYVTQLVFFLKKLVFQTLFCHFTNVRLNTT